MGRELRALGLGLDRDPRLARPRASPRRSTGSPKATARSRPVYDESIYLAPLDTLLELVRATDDAVATPAARRPQSGHGAARFAAQPRRRRCATRSRSNIRPAPSPRSPSRSTIGATSPKAAARWPASSARAIWNSPLKPPGPERVICLALNAPALLLGLRLGPAHSARRASTAACSAAVRRADPHRRSVKWRAVIAERADPVRRRAGRLGDDQRPDGRGSPPRHAAAGMMLRPPALDADRAGRLDRRELAVGGGLGEDVQVRVLAGMDAWRVADDVGAARFRVGGRAAAAARRRGGRPAAAARAIRAAGTAQFSSDERVGQQLADRAQPVGGKGGMLVGRRRRRRDRRLACRARLGAARRRRRGAAIAGRRGSYSLPG